MVIPNSMRNYQEREMMFGFIKLRKCDRIDLFGIKDVERDMLRVMFFGGTLMYMLFLYILLSTNFDK